jgi:hypothetical protein
MPLLEGTSVLPLTAQRARDLIGKEVQYLRKCDIDWSGRGYYFPRSGVVHAQIGRNIAIGTPDNFIYFSSIAEMVLKEP